MEQKSMTGSKTFQSELAKGADDALRSHWPLLLAEYAVLAMRTAKDFGDQRMNLIHAGLGVASDAGEFATMVKKHTVYGFPLDGLLAVDGVLDSVRNHAIEELGDVLWFITLAAQTLGVTLDEVARRNIEKLGKRYPDKYSDEAALARADKAPTDSRLGEE